jgi:TRAP-type C4-dicarboxylate transport system substrate-binding protein
MRIAKLLGIVTALSALAASASASAATVIKIGTVAPSASQYGKQLRSWAEDLFTKTGGAVELQIVYGSAQMPDEASLVNKMKAAQLDGGVLTGVGLAQIHRPILAMQLPGAISSLTKFDLIRDTLSKDNNAGLAAGGFTNLGWFDAGVRRPFSKGTKIRVPVDFKITRPYLPTGDAIESLFFQSIPVTPVQLTLFDVASHLGNQNDVAAVEATSFSVEEDGWSSKIDSATDLVVAYEIGAIVLKSDRVAAFPLKTRTNITDTGTAAASHLASQLHGADDAAWLRLKGKTVVSTPTAADLTQWQAVWQNVRARMKTTNWSPALITQIETLGK